MNRIMNTEADLQMLTYIIKTNRTLRCGYEVPWGNTTQNDATHLTAGARADKVTVAKPAERTAVACSRPMMHRVPMDMSLIAGFPRSSTTKKNQSVRLPQDASTSHRYNL